MSQDLTIHLIFLTIVIGYLLKNSAEKYSEDTLKEKSDLIQPYIENIYTSNKVNEVNEELLNRSLSNYEQALKPSETGFIPPFFTFPSYGTDLGTNENVDQYLNNSLSGQDMSKINEFNKLSNGSNVLDRSQKNITTMPMFNGNTTAADLNESNTTEFNPILNSATSLLSGLPLERIHTNMVPFFGSNVRQNTELYTNVSKLDNHTGNRDTFKHKIESGPRFENFQDNIGSSGTPNIDYINNIDKDRYIPSKYKQGEKPFQEIHVPAPKAGTYINNIRPILKNIDELRPGNKPQITYAGRTVDGQKSSVRGLIGKFNKVGIDPSFEQSFDMLLGGQSVFKGDNNINSSNKNTLTDAIKDSSRKQQFQEYSGLPTFTNYGQQQRYIIGD